MFPHGLETGTMEGIFTSGHESSLQSRDTWSIPIHFWLKHFRVFMLNNFKIRNIFINGSSIDGKYDVRMIWSSARP